MTLVVSQSDETERQFTRTGDHGKAWLIRSTFALFTALPLLWIAAPTWAHDDHDGENCKPKIKEAFSLDDGTLQILGEKFGSNPKVHVGNERDVPATVSPDGKEILARPETTCSS